MISELATHPSPIEAGMAVWHVAEPWVDSVRALAPDAGVLLAELSGWAALIDRHSVVLLQPRAGATWVHWENVDGLAPDARECAFRLGALTGLLDPVSATLSAAAVLDVRHTRCRARGDDVCRFVVEGLEPREDPEHAAVLRECSLLAASLQGREELFRRIAMWGGPGEPFPDVRDTRAARRFMEELEDAVIVFDRNLGILDANRAGVRLSGMSLDELRGLSARDLMSPESYRTVRQWLPALLEAGSMRGLLIEARTRHGWVPAEMSARVSDNGETIVVIGRDVSEHRRLSRELEERNAELAEQNRRIAEADRLKSEFLANVSHELTTPLTSIKGFAKLLVQDFTAQVAGEAPRLTPDKRVEFVSIVQREAERMTELIRGLLELSKIESGVVALDRSRVSLNTIVRESLLVVKPRMDEREITTDVQLDLALEPISLDPDRIKQVALNLLDNAIKFSERGSQVGVRTVRMDRAVRLSVRNSAPEIESGDLDRIFDRFVQRDGSYTRTHGGVGLGLNLVRGIVELHAGRVWAEQPAPDTIEVIVELPA